MARNGKSKVAAVVLAGILVVVCTAVIANAAECALRLTPGFAEGGGGAKVACTVPLSEGATEVAKLTESENFPAPKLEVAPTVEIAEAKFEICPAAQYSPKCGSYDGTPMLRGMIFFYP